MDTYEVDPAKVRSLAGEVLDDTGRLRVLPAAYWATTTREERSLFGNAHGAYSFPTTELVTYLREAIGDRTAIEIGAGNGVLAEALGITATDSREQDHPVLQLYFKLMGQPTVPYGPNVFMADAQLAIRTYKPQVVVACWVTELYDESRHGDKAKAKIGGIDDLDVLEHCETYILVGNEEIHGEKLIWKRPHEVIYPDWLYSRAMNGSRNFIATWRGAR